MKRLIIVVLIPFAFFINACMPTYYYNPMRTIGYSDPEFLNRSYGNMVVYCNIPDYALREQLERNIVSILHSNGIYATEGTRRFPPTREWTDEEIHQSLITNNVDGYLLIEFTEEGTEETYHPARHVTTTEQTEKEIPVKVKHGNKGRRGNENDSTKKEEIRMEKKVEVVTTHKEYPAYIDYDYYVTLDIRLIDVKTGKNAWVGKANPKNRTLETNNYSAYSSDFAWSILEELARAWHIRATQGDLFELQAKQNSYR